MQYDCFLRVIRFEHLFVIVNFNERHGRWEAWIYNATHPSIPRAPVVVLRYSYQHLMSSLASYELVEAGNI